MHRVCVGQPLDTIKTRMQAMKQDSAINACRIIYNQEGIRGLYRGGFPLIIGGALIRSTQFGVYEKVLAFQKSNTGQSWGKENRLSDFNL